MLNKVKRYLQEVKGEFNRISWPRRDEVIALTMLVIIMIIILSIYIGGVDALLQLVIRYLIG
jgi:preprotein translocase subunit SecE